MPDKKGENERDQFVAWRLCLTRLFGNEKEVDVRAKNPEVYLDRLGDEELFKKYRAELKKMAWEGYRRGRLMFYPTFFKKLGLEVINPHDRETGAGTLPIYLETVPKGAKGTFSLLYVPFDRVGKEIGVTEEKRRRISAVWLKELPTFSQSSASAPRLRAALAWRRKR